MKVVDGGVLSNSHKESFGKKNHGNQPCFTPPQPSLLLCAWRHHRLWAVLAIPSRIVYRGNNVGHHATALNDNVNDKDV